MIQITEKAAQMIQEIRREQGEEELDVRIRVAPGWGGVRCRLTLDESTDFDQKFEEKGILFLVDTFAMAFIEKGVRIDYDEQEDNFVVKIIGAEESSCWEKFLFQDKVAYTNIRT